MARSTIVVLVGYVAITLVGAALFTGAYFVVGMEIAFVGDAFEISVLMAACGLAASFVGGLAGGWVCQKISRRPATSRVLAGVALVLTLASGIPMLLRERSLERRPREMSSVDAMTRASHPRWFTLLFPVGQAVGVWMIGRRRPRGRTSTASG